MTNSPTAVLCRGCGGEGTIAGLPIRCDICYGTGFTEPDVEFDDEIQLTSDACMVCTSPSGSLDEDGTCSEECLATMQRGLADDVAIDTARDDLFEDEGNWFT